MKTAETQALLLDDIIVAELNKGNQCAMNIVYARIATLSNGLPYATICRREFMDLKYEGGNIRLFMLKYRSMLLDAGMTWDDDAVDAFIAKLPDQLQTAVAAVTGLDKISKIVEWITAYGHTTIPVNAHSTTIDANKAKMEEMEAEMEKLKDALAQVTVNATATQNNQNNNNGNGRGRGSQPYGNNNNYRGNRGRGRGYNNYNNYNNNNNNRNNGNYGQQPVFIPVPFSANGRAMFGLPAMQQNQMQQ